jgi:hypothetical protein
MVLPGEKHQYCKSRLYCDEHHLGYLFDHFTFYYARNSKNRRNDYNVSGWYNGAIRKTSLGLSLRMKNYETLPQEIVGKLEFTSDEQR